MLGEGAQREQEKGTRTEGAPSFAEAVRKHCFPGPNPSGHVLGEEELVIACGLSKKMSLSWYSAGSKILKALLGGGEWRGTPTKSKHSFSFYMGRRVLEKDKLIFVTRCGAPDGKHIFQEELCEQRCPYAQRMPGLLGRSSREYERVRKSTRH